MFVMKLTIVICVYINTRERFGILNGGLSVVATHPEVFGADVR